MAKTIKARLENLEVVSNKADNRPGKPLIIFSVLGPNSTPDHYNITARYMETYDDQGKRTQTPLTESEYQDLKKNARKIVKFGEPK